MGKINARTKGSAFERKIATMLREWLGPQWIVMRNQTDRQKGQVDDQGGEFTITHLDKTTRFPWAIECKAVEAFDHSQLWDAPIGGPLPKFWAQAVRQAEIVARRPLLIFKRNFCEILVAEEGCHYHGHTAMQLTLPDGTRLTVRRFSDMLTHTAPPRAVKKLPPPLV